MLPPGLKKKRGYDLGISKQRGRRLHGKSRRRLDREGNIYIYGGFRKRIEYPDQKKLILGRILAEPDTEHGIELSANGNAVVQDLRRDARIRGHALRGVRVVGDKVTRALSWIALAEAGNVYLVRGPWNNEFIDEACSFPLGRTTTK